MRQCEFIKADGRVWVPSPGSWMEGWARQRWLERYFGEGCVSVTSSENWARLFYLHPAYSLVEESGTFTEVKIQKPKKKKTTKVKK